MTNKTELVFILDRSGSMDHLTEDTIGGFNSMIKKQKKEEVNALVTTVLFDDESEILHDRLDLSKVPAMTTKEYYARGCTALLDAIGSTITHISNIHKYARPEDLPEKTLFVITTDGHENASKAYTFTKVKEMVEKQKSESKWEFLFLGANIDAIATAERFGIDEKHSANVMNDEEGTQILYQSVGEMCCCYSQECCEELPVNWKRKIEADYKIRSKKKSRKTSDINKKP